MSLRRINIYGGPGAGKSTASHFLMWRLKSSGHVAELAREWIKRLAYKGEDIDRFLLQTIACGAQLEEELAALATGAVVVSESPILLQAAYASHELDAKRSILTAQELDRVYPAVHIVLDRGAKQYSQAGRWENEELAREKDQTMIELLDIAGFLWHKVGHDDWDSLWEIVEPLLG